MNEEIWKDVVGFEGKYMVSNFGRVKTVERYIDMPNGGKKYIPSHILKQYFDTFGYYRINLMTKTDTRRKCAVHRLVAEAFIPNPNKYPVINHKDENKTNNKITNLEWCTYKYNTNYGTAISRRSKKQNLAVEMIDINTEKVLKTFDSIKLASEYTGITVSCISAVCKKKHQHVTAGGYSWRYADKSVRDKNGVDESIKHYTPFEKQNRKRDSKGKFC